MTERQSLFQKIKLSDEKSLKKLKSNLEKKVHTLHYKLFKIFRYPVRWQACNSMKVQIHWCQDSIRFQKLSSTCTEFCPEILFWIVEIMRSFWSSRLWSRSKNQYFWRGVEKRLPKLFILAKKIWIHYLFFSCNWKNVFLLQKKLNWWTSTISTSNHSILHVSIC